MFVIFVCDSFLFIWFMPVHMTHFFSRDFCMRFTSLHMFHFFSYDSGLYIRLIYFHIWLLYVIHFFTNDSLTFICDVWIWFISFHTIHVCAWFLHAMLTLRCDSHVNNSFHTSFVIHAITRVMITHEMVPIFSPRKQSRRRFFKPRGSETLNSALMELRFPLLICRLSRCVILNRSDR